MTNLEAAVQALVQEVSARFEERALIPAQDFWARFNMASASQQEREALLAVLQQRQLAVTLDPRRGAVYLVWMGKTVKVNKVRRAELAAAEAEVKQRQQQRRVELLATPPLPIDLQAPKLRAMSIRQPYAELIVQGRKQQENRSKPPPKPLGPMLIHASQTLSKTEQLYAQQHGLHLDELVRGAVVGIMDIVGSEEDHNGHHWLVTNPRRFAKPIPYSGAVGIFYVETDLVREQLLRL